MFPSVRTHADATRDANMDTSLEPLLIRNRDAKRLLGCGNTKFWQLVKDGEIEVVGEGAMSRALYSSVKNYVDRLRAQASGKAT
jgi:hypothetical protein